MMEKRVTQMDRTHKDNMDFRDALLYLGYNLHNDHDLERLVKNATWVNVKREADEKQIKNRPGFRVALVTTIISTILSGLVTWLTTLLK